MAGPVDAARRARGAWATPPALVEFVLDRTLDPVLAVRPSIEGLVVLDPACGDGRFLTAAAARIARRYGVSRAHAERCCVGIELDPATAAGARGGEILLGNALDDGWDVVADVVVGNPPFLTPLRRRTGGGRAGSAPYADAASEFWRVAMQRVRPGARVGLVLPTSVLAARDAAPARREVSGSGAVVALWWAGTSMFEAAVDTCVITAVRGERQGPIERWCGPEFAPLPPVDGRRLDDRPAWGHLLADAAGIPAVELEGGAGTIGDLAAVTADFRDQYYGLVGAVHDGGEGPPLVPAGLLDPGRCRWGERPVRFARQRYSAPRVDLDALAPALRRWAERRLVPKIVLATQTRVLEAAVDESGAWLPSVPVLSVIPHDVGDLWRLGAVLCAPPVSAWAAATYLGAGLSGATVKLSARQVAALVLPVRPEAWDDGAAALRAGDVVACAEAMCSAYAMADRAVLEWWRAAARLERGRG